MINSTYNGHPVHLIESVKEFDYIKSLLDPKVLVGLDTEDTGLQFKVDQVVGVCISCGHSTIPKDYHGFYLPIRHVSYDKNLPVVEVIAFVQWIVDNFKTIWWNRNYDFTMLEQDGFVCPYIGHTHDAQCAAHLVKGESFPALKQYAHDYLKYEVIDFQSNKAENNNFGSTDPTITFVYASQDPIVTALLMRKLWAEYPYIRKVYPIDNKVGEALRRICLTTELYLDKDRVQAMLDEVDSKLSEVKQKIYSLVGYRFQLNSNKEKADALGRFVTLTAKTSKGQFAMNEEALSKIDHPLAKLFLEYAELNKFKGTYLDKMMEFPQPFHINYQHTNVSTGRLSSGTSKGNPYFVKYNIQNVPKEESYKYLHVGGPVGYYLDTNPEGAISKMKTKSGMRDCFVCPPGYVWFSADYASEEVVIMACFSGENNLLEPLSKGEDIHKFIATKMFGVYQPTHRTISKQITFASNYGGGGYTIAKRLTSLGVPTTEKQGEELLNRYNATLPQLTRWKESMMKEARRKGMVFTYFGRPRMLYMYYNSSKPSDWGFADRTAVNSPVQGTGGDLIRIDLCKLQDLLEGDPEFRKNVKFALTVHDEIDVFVKPSYLKKCFDTITSLMYFKPSNFQVPVHATPSVGLDWGSQIDCDGITEDNKIILKEFEGKSIEELQKKFREENPELFA